MCVDGLLEVILNPGNAGKGLEALARKCSKIQLSFLCSKHWDVGYSLEEEGPDTNNKNWLLLPGSHIWLEVMETQATRQKQKTEF